MVYIGITQLRSELLTVLNTVAEKKEPIVVLRQNKPIAVIVPFDPVEHSGVKFLSLKEGT